MKIIPLLIGLPLALYVFDKFGLWLERNGWLYYRNQKPQGGTVGNALQELQALLTPSSRHVIEMKQQRTQAKTNEKSSSGDLPH